MSKQGKVRRETRYAAFDADGRMVPATITDHLGSIEVKMSVAKWEAIGPICVRPIIVEYPELLLK